MEQKICNIANYTYFCKLKSFIKKILKIIIMQKGIHPKEYRLVAFKDMSNDHTFITKTTARSKETIEIEGTEYPLIKIEISNTSHPYFTGKMKLVDTAGRVDKFKKRYAKFVKN